MKKAAFFNSATLNRLLLLLTGHIAGYQIITGIEGSGAWALTNYTIAFGILILSCMILIIFGLDVLENSAVVVVATILPLSLSLGLISEYLASFRMFYALFAIVGFSLILVTRITSARKAATLVLASVHGIAGLVIFILPIVLCVRRQTTPFFLLVGLGGALFGLSGMLLAVLKVRGMDSLKTRLNDRIPLLLLLVTTLLVIGLAAG